MCIGLGFLESVAGGAMPPFWGVLWALRDWSNRAERLVSERNAEHDATQTTIGIALLVGGIACRALGPVARGVCSAPAARRRGGAALGAPARVDAVVGPAAARLLGCEDPGGTRRVDVVDAQRPGRLPACLGERAGQVDQRGRHRGKGVVVGPHVHLRAGRLGGAQGHGGRVGCATRSIRARTVLV